LFETGLACRQRGRQGGLLLCHFHPESWNPAWSVETILVGLLSFFISDVERGYGAIESTVARRQQLASASQAANARNPEFRTLFPEFLEAQPSPLEISDASAEELSRQEEHSDLTAEPPCTEVRIDVIDSNTSVEAGQGISSDVEQHSATPRADDVDDEAIMECWICRDTSLAESLIMPCACRGSMSGVHRTCVEEWIRHHRRNAINDEVPRCSVCHQEYRGSERRPGVGTFLSQICQNVMQQFCRTLVLVFLAAGFQISSTSVYGVPLWIRIPLIVIFSVAALYKLMVLTVSLPPHVAPPRNVYLRRFFISDFNILSMHISEVFATMTIFFYWYLTGNLTLPYFLPYVAACLIPIIKICWRPLTQHRRVAGEGDVVGCLRRSVLCMLKLFLSPFILIWLIATLMLRQPRRPSFLDADLHLIVALVVFVLLLGCESNVPVVVLWCCHSVFLAFGVTELFLVRRLHWRQSVVWWIALELVVLASYLANTTLTEFPKGWGAPRHTKIYIFAASFVWFLLYTVLTLAVNWPSVVHYYRTWQRRRGSFTLQDVPPEATISNERREGHLLTSPV